VSDIPLGFRRSAGIERDANMLCCQRRLVPVVAMCSAFVGACGSSSSGPAPDAAVDAPSQTGEAGVPEGGTDAPTSDGTVVPDGSGAEASTQDAATQDATTGSGDAGPADGGGTDAEAGDRGTSDGGVATRVLVPGSNLILFGVTRDDYAIYCDASSQTYYAQPLGSGSRATISTSPPSLSPGCYGAVIGNVAFVWSWNSQYVGTATVWSSGMSQGVPLTTSGLAYYYQTLWASDDGKHVAYVQTTSADSTVSSIYGANVDGTGATLLVSSIDTNDAYQGNLPACFPRLVFRGDYAVLSYCTAADAGLTPELRSFSISGGWAPAAVVPNWIDSLQYYPADWAQFTFPFAVDPDGGRIAAASASSGNGALQIFPIDGGSGTVVDPNVLQAPSLSFAGSVQNPWSILYNNDAGALRQASADNPMPQILVDAGVNYFNGFSADGKWMLVSSARNVHGWFSDLSLVSTQSPGAPVLVVSSSEYDASPVAASSLPTNATRGFTTDSAYALAMTNLQINHENQWIGELRSTPVAPPYVSKPLGNGFIVAYVPLRGSKVLVGDNFEDTDGGSSPSVDLDEVDPASDGGAVNIARGTWGAAAPSSDLTQVVYTVVAGAAPGIYVSTLP
jgi:hypothetical protein